MRILVTGLHRSGTSVAARLVAEMSGLSLYDDPQWAIFHPMMARAYRSVSAYRAKLDAAEVVKCPRMGECLCEVLTDYPGARAVFLVRDPRDVLCSIMEALNSGDQTVGTMTDNDRFGPHDELWEGVALAFNAYGREALAAAESAGDRVLFLAYSKLFARPATVVPDLLAALGLAAATDFPLDLAARQLAPLRNKSVDDPTIKGPGRWCNELPQDVADAVDGACSETLAELTRLCISNQ